MRGKTQLKFGSLFSGGMGLDLGLEKAGFSPLFCSDIFQASIDTIRYNRPAIPVFTDPIQEISGERIYFETGLKTGELALLSGGPPCQSFSTAGKRLGGECNENGHLAFEFIRLVNELRPKAFLMENVKGILSASIHWRKLPYNNNGKIIDEHHGSLLRKIMHEFNSIGYSVAYQLINSAHYGVPQFRERVFFIGYRDGTAPSFPMPTHGIEDGLFAKKYATVGDVIGNITKDDSHCARFSPRKQQYMSMIPEGGNWRDLPIVIQQESMGKAFLAKGGRSGYWRRISMNAPSPTILTEPNNASTALGHPKENRPLSVLECARIQTFPDNWKFVGKGSDQYRLIGNAVPVLLAEVLGRHIIQLL